MSSSEESIKIDLSKAGQCNVLAAKVYFKFQEGTVILTSFNFVNDAGMLISLKSYPGGKNALHCVLLHRPSADKNTWKIIDPTYVGDDPVNFKDYMKVLAIEYEGDIDFIKFRLEINQGINRWVAGYPTELDVEWSEIIN